MGVNGSLVEDLVYKISFEYGDLEGFAIEYEGKFVGISTLTDIDWKNRSAFHGIKLVPNAPKGKGIGYDAVCGTMKYAFEELQLNRLEGGMLTYNIPSRKLYEKCGWKEEGLFREKLFKNNQYHDEEKHNLRGRKILKLGGIQLIPQIHPRVLRHRLFHVQLSLSERDKIKWLRRLKGHMDFA